MIPYARVPDITLVPARLLGARWPADNIALRPFGLLVVVGIWVGIGLTLHACRKRRVPIGAAKSYLIWHTSIWIRGRARVRLALLLPPMRVKGASVPFAVVGRPV